MNKITLQHKPTDGLGIVASEIDQPSSSPEHTASRFRHQRLLTRSNQRSPIGHVACLSLARRSEITHLLPFNLRPPCSGAPSRYFILLTSLSQSLSLYLKSLKWNEWDSLSLSLYSLRLTLSDSFELWLAEVFNFINIFPYFWLFGFILSVGVGVGVCWCWCWWDINCLLV